MPRRGPSRQVAILKRFVEFCTEDASAEPLLTYLDLTWEQPLHKSGWIAYHEELRR